ncbi:MAG: single-stranded DNA-binding protein [Candidatus Melainabacteria bacterium]|nr:single-stranded DNA-binding protein [Candidatus Melainabacteria bacterium]
MNNAVTLVGHVGQTPSVKTFCDTGNKVVRFSLAVREYSSNTDEQKTMWVDVVAWNGLGDRVLSTITKGREVVVNGRLSISTYSKSVQDEEVTISKPVIKLSGFHLCGPKPTSDGESTSDEVTSKRARKKST